jgi:hypothetical protein
MLVLVPPRCPARDKDQASPISICMTLQADNIGEGAGEQSTEPQAHSHDDVLGCAEAYKGFKYR